MAEQGAAGATIDMAAIQKSINESVAAAVSAAMTNVSQQLGTLVGTKVTEAIAVHSVKEVAAVDKTGNAQATQPMVAELGKTTCGACHTAFRGPEIKK